MSTRSLSRPRALLLDLDGTLADTAPDLAGAVNKLRTDRGLEPVPLATLTPHASAGARALIGAGFGLQPGDDGYAALLAGFLDNYEAAIAVKTTLFGGIPDMLARVRLAGVVWGVVTNKPMRFTDRLVPLLELGSPACVVSGDTTPYAKPHPAPLLKAAELLGLAPSDCWYVGDDLRDIQAGKAAGMVTIAAAWGYCGTVEPQSWDADAIAGSPLNLLAMVQDSL